MNNVTDFDASKYRLGSLCRLSHRWNETEQSLRYFNNWACVECRKLKKIRSWTHKEILQFDLKFWSYVNQSDALSCWHWKRCTSSGYGVFIPCNGIKGYAHRAAYELTYGEISEGLFVCHRCDNPPCCNPSHLFLGTVVDNAQDMKQKGRSCRGSKNGQNKLKVEQVLEIRKRYPEEKISHSALAEQYGVSRHTIGEILSRKRWKWLI